MEYNDQRHRDAVSIFTGEVMDVSAGELLMNHTFNKIGALLTFGMLTLLLWVPGCSSDKALPEVEGVTATRGTATADNPGSAATILVTWDASTDERVDGYVIYRAEQGIGSTEQEKSSFEVQAITFATRICR